eukprot:1078882-Amphidinium_carterae.1
MAIVIILVATVGSGPLQTLSGHSAVMLPHELAACCGAEPCIPVFKSPKAQEHKMFGQTVAKNESD